MKVIIIIPAYNEEHTISKVVREIKDIFPSFDILVVNDGSVDLTGTVARKEECQVLDLINNLGIGGAVQAGFKYAQEYGYDIAVQLDGDGQHDPLDLRYLLEPILNRECDVVIGSRFIKGEGFQSTPMRRIGIRYFSAMILLLTGSKISDPTSGYRAFNKDVIKLLASSYPRDYPEPEALLLLIRSGRKIKETPVTMRQRTAGESSIRETKIVYYMIKVTLGLIMVVLKKQAESRRL